MSALAKESEPLQRMASTSDTTEFRALGHTLLGYEPIIDRHRRAMAMRLSARSPAAQSCDLAGAYADLADLWPDTTIPVLLRSADVPSEASFRGVKPSRQVWLEVPSVLTGHREGLDFIADLHRRGFTLVLGGRPVTVLPPSLLTAFRLSVISVGEERRQRPGDGDGRTYTRTIPYAQSGVQSIAALRRSFDIGATACIGWPFEDALQHATRSDSNPDFATITRLLGQIQQDADPADIEETIRRDAALAYRLLRYINSAAFGLSVEIQSFRHAVMMLGYQRMKRWLLLMLTTASKDANMQPVMLASYRRGLFLEGLASSDGRDHEQRDEAFILGVLSLLDKLFREPLPALLDKLYVADSIREALLEGTGPHAVYLRVASAVENPGQSGLPALLDEAFLSIAQCNRALTHALITGP